MLPQHNRNAGALLGNTPQCIFQRPAKSRGIDRQHVGNGVFQMHAHHHRLIRPDLALDQGKVNRVAKVVLVSDQFEIAILCRQNGFGNALDGALVLDPVLDEIRNGADFQAMFGGEFHQIVTARHAAVFVQNLDDRRRRLEAGKPRQITAGLGMPGTGQHASGLRHEGKDMPRLHDVLRLRIRRDSGTDCQCPVVGGNTGGYAFSRFDGDSEIGTVTIVGAVDHQRQGQLLAAFARQGQTDQATAVFGHEVDVLGPHHRGNHQQVTFVFAVLVVDDDDHFALGEVGEDFFDGVECHVISVLMNPASASNVRSSLRSSEDFSGSPISRRSRYRAITSTSILTRSPACS